MPSWEIPNGAPQRRSNGCHTQAPCRTPRSRSCASCSATGRHRWPARRARSSPGISRNPEADRDVVCEMAAKPPWLTVHPLSPEDSLGATRSPSERRSLQRQARRNGCPRSVRRRHERVAAPAGVTFVADTVGGISGWWRNRCGRGRVRRSFTCMAAGSTWEPPRVPEFRRAHRFERWS